MIQFSTKKIEKLSKKDIIHDFDNLPKHLISKCPKCGSLYNNAEDISCLKCGHKFFRDGFKPNGMTENDIEQAISSANIITSEIRETIKENKKRKNRFWTWIRKIIKSFFVASYFSLVFLFACSLFLKNTDIFSYSDKAIIGNINLWRIVFIYGAMCLITTLFLVIRKKKQLITIIFLWIFWILGVGLVFIATQGNSLGIHLYSSKLTSHASIVNINNITIFGWFFIWLFGIYYCFSVAKKIKVNKNLAITVGFLLPVLSILIYAFCSFRKKNKRERIKSIKIFASAILLFAIISAGIIYYAVGTPEYSLYKLKQAILTKNNTVIEKYVDVENISKGSSESAGQYEDKLISSMNTSFWEIKEENPDKSKNAKFFIPTGLMGDKLKNASLVFTKDQTPLLLLKFTPEGSKLFSEITEQSSGKSIALYLNGQLFSSLVIKSQINDGAINFAPNNSYSADQISLLAVRMNNEKNGKINGLEIENTKIEKKIAKVIVGVMAGNEARMELSLSKMPGRIWKITQVDFVSTVTKEKLPAPEGEKVATFDWKYKGKSYSIDEKLYDSFYKFYYSLHADVTFNGESAVGWQEKNNDMFIDELQGDDTLKDIAQSLKDIADKNKFDDNQLAELVASFVQTIPYDFDKFNKAKAGENTKVFYPYEVLYNDTGVCSDKSYLSYSLLRDLGYGVSIFLFPEDQHMAVGVKCPLEYSNYDSGYCFLETTSLGNKIGWKPNISKKFGMATSKLELGDFSNDTTETEYNPLGKIEILNKIDGKEYTGIIETRATERELSSLSTSIRKMDQELKISDKKLNAEEDHLDRMENKLKKMEKDIDNYEDYKDYYDKYEKAYKSLGKDIKSYNKKVDARNQLNDRYSNLSNSFYQ